MATTLFDKVWDRHVITGKAGEPQLLYVDLHLIHEVTSPQPFDGLRESGRQLRRPDRTFATIDHNVPTAPQPVTTIADVKDQIARRQIETLQKNCRNFGVHLADIGDADQGIVHVIGPHLGLTQPGRLIVCGDSHTSTHGALGALAFGIGTSEIEHVFTTQTIWQVKPKNLGVHLTGHLAPGVFAKDIVMALIAKYGTNFAEGYALEFYGPTIADLSIENRLTLTNMIIEGGAKMAMIQPDQTTFDYLRGRRYAPKDYEQAVAEWQQFKTDSPAAFDRIIELDVSNLAPYVSWGTNPAMALPCDATLPAIADQNMARAYQYMDLQPGQAITTIPINWLFIGSCTNGRLSDLQEAAKILAGHHLAPGVQAWVVPGSRAVQRAAERLGLDQIFKAAGCEWRDPGCSACLAMNPDKVPAGKHCASTTNRNFEGRQGPGARTHLASPAMVAAAGIYGHFVDVRQFYEQE